jgi:hypothetical protein
MITLSAFFSLSLQCKLKYQSFYILECWRHRLKFNVITADIPVNCCLPHI